jgi:hypothetical protein
MREHRFTRKGLGYHIEFPEIRTTFEIDHLRTTSEGIKGDLIVRTQWPGARTYEDDLLHYSKETISSQSTRRSLGKTLSDKVPSPENEKLDWFGLYDQFCTLVMLTEREGYPGEDVGERPDRIGPRLLLDPLVPYETHSILFGDGGVGKSILAVAAAVTTRTGREIIPGLVPSLTGPVLYLNWETGPDDIDERVKAVCRGAHISPVSIRHISGRGKTLASQAEAFARIADDVGAVLLIVDSLGKAIGTSGEGPIEDAANRFSSSLDEIGRSALCIDHVTKSAAADPSGAGKPIGSGMKSNWARATWEMRQAKIPDSDGTAHVALYHRKHNTTPKHAPIGLSMSWADGSVSWINESITDSDLSRGLSLAERMTQLLSVHPLRPKEIAEELDAPEGSVRVELSRRKDRFVKIETGDWAVLSTAV